MRYGIIAVFVLLVIGTCVLAYAEVDSEKLGRDDFISSSLSAVVDKVDKYTSGEKDIFLSNDEKSEKKDEGDYDTDALGRKIPKVPIRSTTTPSNNKQ